MKSTCSNCAQECVTLFEDETDESDTNSEPTISDPEHIGESDDLYETEVDDNDNDDRDPATGKIVWAKYGIFWYPATVVKWQE